MSFLTIISIGLAGFAVAGLFYSVLAIWVKKTSAGWWQLMLLSLLFTVFTVCSGWRREIADPLLATYLTKLTDIFCALFFAMIPFVYRGIFRTRPDKVDWGILIAYSLFVIWGLSQPAGYVWVYIDRMIQQDFGRFGIVYFPHGVISPVAMVFEVFSLLVLLYCVYSAIINIRKTNLLRIIILVPLPIPLILATVIYMGNQHGWWNLPAIAEYFRFAIYLQSGWQSLKVSGFL